MIDEGYIKYRCDWIREDAIAQPLPWRIAQPLPWRIAQPLVQKIDPETINNLTAYRNALHRLNLIGEYSNGIGFGNVSHRLLPSQLLTLDSQFSGCSDDSWMVGGAHPTGCSPVFVITGTQTGNLPTLAAGDYALVTAFNPEQNTLTCRGLRQASSESLTHGVIYASQPAINAIVHVHSPQLWKRLLHQVPTTRADVPYGTPEMAAETQRLFQESPLLQQKIFVMAGHEDGIVTFGENLQTAYRVLINWSLMTGFMTQPDSEFALQLPYQPA